MKTIQLLTQNSKIKKSKKRTFNFGIPAYQAADGFKTCPNAAACAVGCYARSGAYRFSNVAQAFERRLKIYLDDPKLFVETMVKEIKKKKAERIRIHDSGDFFDINYTLAWFNIMDMCPDVEFYAYTKQVSMFKSIVHIPSNFTLIFSFGGKQDKLIDVNEDRHSAVFESLEELKAAGYADASENDDIAIEKNPRIGLVYHGNKNYANTDWQKVKKGA